MGQAYLFKCTQCKYKAESSGGKDFGFIAVVEPYICNDCKKLTDVLIGEFGKQFSVKSLSKEQRKEYYCCSYCHSKNITKWNTKTKPCPKCGSRMKKDPDGLIINWD